MITFDDAVEAMQQAYCKNSGNDIAQAHCEKLLRAALPALAQMIDYEGANNDHWRPHRAPGDFVRSLLDDPRV